MAQIHSETTPVIDYSRKWLVLSAVAMGIFLATIDGSIVNVALPTLSAALGADFATVQWVVLSYLLTITTVGNATRAVEHHCTVSIGVALFLDHEGHRDDILKWADAAMYQAKDDGRRQIRFHDATRRGVARMR